MVLVHNICLVMLAVEQAGHLYENTTISMTKDLVSNTSLEVLLAAAAIYQRCPRSSTGLLTLLILRLGRRTLGPIRHSRRDAAAPASAARFPELEIQ